jgi:hypothetical protein
MQQSAIFIIFVKVMLSNFGPTTHLFVTALSCVSVPILHLQQQDLAFISEFNVQILYLPGLKNIIVDFLSYPHTPGAVAAAAADPVGF